MTLQRTLHSLAASMVALMSVGSQVVRLPMMTITSLEAWGGMWRREDSTSSREFCSDGSPTQGRPARLLTTCSSG